MKIIFMIAFAVLLAIFSTVDGLPWPAIEAYSHCKPKSGMTIKGANCKQDGNIQMGEAWANTRIQGQLFGFFVADPPGAKSAKSEGSPYGTGVGCDSMPTAADLVASTNPADWCFVYKPKNPNNNRHSKNTVKPPTIPGKPGLPMPIVCPHNLKPCYSAKYYEPGGPLAAWADKKPTYEGPWVPLQDPSSKTPKPLFCEGLNLGCDTLTNADFQLHRMAAKKPCDTSKCQPFGGKKGSGTGGGTGTSPSTSPSTSPPSSGGKKRKPNGTSPPSGSPGKKPKK